MIDGDAREGGSANGGGAAIGCRMFGTEGDLAPLAITAGVIDEIYGRALKGG
ncbi:MAG TPA: hypothetical protein VFG91_02540 [Woeseiaceae bacterium]|nr:hypothetical protein [Woeseiaceae bacterium]